MSFVPHLASDPASAPRPSAKVATVAGMLECEPGDIRRLIRAGELATHGKGKRGVRVYLDSVRAYQDRQDRPAAPQRRLIHKPAARTPASTAAFRSAMAGLAAKGLA